VPVVLYGYKVWYPTLREEHRLRVSENWVLREIFRPKRNEVTGEWRKLHNEGLVIKSRRRRLADHVARMGDREGAYGVLVGRSDGRDHLEYLDVDGRVMLKWIIKNLDGET
jgi:hypothetical protein